jgi:O-antigen/teichoic acid export membrane protein
MGSRLVGALTLVAVPVVLTHIFEQVDYGLFGQFQLVFQSLKFLALFGSLASLQYFVAREEETLRIIATCVLQVLVSVMLLGLVLASWGDEIIGLIAASELSVYKVELLLAVLCYSLGEVLTVTLVARKRFIASSALHLGFALLRATLVVTVALATKSLSPVIWALVAVGFVQAATSLVFILSLLREQRAWPTWQELRRQLRYGLPMGAAAVVKHFGGQIHRYLIAAKLDPSAFAIYRIGTIKVPMVGQFQSTVALVTTPHFATMERDREYRRILGMWHASMEKLSLVYFPAAAYLICFAPDLIRAALPESYLPAAGIFRVFTLLLVFGFVGGVEGILKAFAQTRFIMVTSILSLVVGFALAWIGLRELGVIGPALAFVVTTGAFLIVRILKIQSLLELELSRLLPWRHLVLTAMSSLMAAGCAYLATLWWSGIPLLRVVLSLIISASVYVAAVLLLRLITERDREWLRQTWVSSLARLRSALPVGRGGGQPGSGTG